MNGTTARTAGLASGALVALVAGLASYTHMRELAAAHGEQWLSWLVPLSVDGLLVVASLVIVAARREGQRGPVLAWLALVVGVLASLAANVAHAGGDPVSRLVAAWPPVAFAVAFELVLRLVKSTSTAAEQPAVPAGAEEPIADTEEHQRVFRPSRVNARSEPLHEQSADEADPLIARARELFATHGRLGRARLARELGVTQHQARRVLAELAADGLMAAGEVA